MAELIGVGIVGCGHVAELRHLPALAGLEGARISAVADIDGERAERVGERFGVPRRYREASELLSDPDVEAVGVLVPASRHAEVALAALEAGKHVLVEKPLALDLDDCDRMIQAAAGSSARIGVAFNLRAHKLVREARERIADGLVGPVEGVWSVTSGRDQVDGSRGTWRGERRLGAGTMFEKAPHHYDLWRWLSGSEVREVSAIFRPGPQADEASIVSARMESGAIASSTFVDSQSTTNQISVQGPGGRLDLSVLEFDGLRFTPASRYPGDLRLKLRRLGEAAMRLPSGVRTARGGGEYVLSYAREWQSFLEAIRGREAVACALEDGRKALEIALAAISSGERGQTVRIDEAPRDLAAALEG